MYGDFRLTGVTITPVIHTVHLVSVVLKLYRKCTVPVRGEQKNGFPGPGEKPAGPDSKSFQPGPVLKILEAVQQVPKILDRNQCRYPV